ncbi:hypothetical protein [Kibdelosporangium aridum]|nr:hypothetical protein [Kibdelosporangium aridum]
MDNPHYLFHHDVLVALDRGFFNVNDVPYPLPFTALRPKFA